MRRIAATLLAALVLAGCGSDPATPDAATSSAAAESPTARAAPSPTDRRCADPELNDKQVAFQGTGAFLTGLLLGTGRTVLVLAPQASADACSWLSWARQEAAAGYRVLALDFAGEGRSQRRESGTPSADVLSAVAYARTLGVERVVLIGASRGGTAALVAAAAATPPVTAVISLSAPDSYAGEDAAAAVPRLTVPVLYVAATGDTSFAADAQAMYDATTDKRRGITLVPGRLHGTALLTITGEGAPEAAKAVTGFLATHAAP
ncbi:alpha/beta fold hydrolase [Dactylosporangium aurantiacum]|uniref:Alpha/beta fold hydrolase n=1 Tax=Dactylosporangium aurantiacum TaxID=35754 RepID=A0A9Q9IC79_9ACTN|nr:alpha/beta fold hydrolase [Dactylosporangium aurantiacum]MDG6105205.1 alpha/beta fold hydrolase [Dactylosporangium aurantiacum]UWZ51723.1 alpha/beta fold hydrolase [Dactylosporangium aurantiacum]